MEKIVLWLDSDEFFQIVDLTDFMSFRYLPCSEVGARDISYLSVVDKVVERSKRFVKGCFLVEAMEIIDIDELSPQAL